jgi:erythronate-4-phosphate dehydrogenase
MARIVVDRNIRGATNTFGRHGSLVAMEGRSIRNQDLRDVDILIVRTATRIDQALLEGTAVRFVGTTSIGTDHLDIPWLEQQGIAWANAPGCNAEGAAQYTLAMIWLALERLGRPLAGQRVGIIGCGNVGSRVQRLLQALGARTVANDPPLADAGHGPFVSLDEALDSDIVCLHTPLTRSGPYPTLRMIGRRQLGRMPDGALLVNAGRGDVIDGPALLAALQSGRLHSALDVWPGEPWMDAELLRAAAVATPHVAGYSDEGRRNGTRIVYHAYCRWAGIEPAGEASDASLSGPELDVPAGVDGLTAALDAACFVRTHDRAMRELAGQTTEQRAAGFDRLRREYPLRHDFQAWTVHCPDPETARLLSRVGFSATAIGS